MDTALKLVGTIIVLTIVLNTSLNLIKTYNHYNNIRVLADEINNMIRTMNTLKTISSEGSWEQTIINIPTNYSLYFNNQTSKLEVHGEEEYEITLNNTIKYNLNLTTGQHTIQLYYGQLKYDELKNNTLVFT